MRLNCFQVAAFSVHCLHGLPEEHIRKITQLCTPTAGSKVPEFQPCGSVMFCSGFGFCARQKTYHSKTRCRVYTACLLFHFGKWHQKNPQWTFGLAPFSMDRTSSQFGHWGCTEGELHQTSQKKSAPRNYSNGRTHNHTDRALVVRFWQPAGLRTLRIKLQSGKRVTAVGTTCSLRGGLQVLLWIQVLDDERTNAVYIASLEFLGCELAARQAPGHTICSNDHLGNDAWALLNHQVLHQHTRRKNKTQGYNQLVDARYYQKQVPQFVLRDLVILPVCKWAGRRLCSDSLRSTARIGQALSPSTLQKAQERKYRM